MENQMSFLDLPSRPKPRRGGETGLYDMFMPLAEQAALLETASECIDYAKLIHIGLAFGGALPSGWLQEKLGMYRAKGIKTFPGGVPYQVALVQGKVPQFMKWVRDSGFDGLEIAEDAMSYRASTDQERDDHIKMALDLGLFVDTELGKKNPEAPLDLAEAYDTMMRDLGMGVAHVVLERSELDHYKGEGKDPSPVVDLVRRVGLEKVLIEPGPFGWPDYHDWTFKTFGPEVNVGNIYPHELLYVELSRRGLSRFGYWYFDKFEHMAR
ncbi:phosphosulfolactate synthase [Variovorax sp. RA8]|uniref:phosphosulfolactate synthase n=1 Tax=Variovorax sp. (strain JCM 16519 / RA8) TaxID=662548 RepID=UPI000A7EA28F|nr:phosphosulfolactate synthase [Variovorax sp. RA8]VTU15318.1 phosphosulfolactate synthase [Variovorax sp. RA8]